MTSKYGFSVVAPISVTSAVLDRGQQRVLLRLVEAVDLVEEEDRALAVAAEPVARAAACTPRTSSTRAETAESSSNAAPVVSATMRASVVFPTPGRPVEDQRAQPVLLDREPERRALAEHVLLADELVERPRPQPLRERRRRGRALPRRVGEEVAHRPEVCSGRWQRTPGRGLLPAGPAGRGAAATTSAT